MRIIRVFYGSGVSSEFAPLHLGMARRDVVVAGHLGDHQAVTAGLAHHDASVRSAALGGLARIEQLTEQHLISALTDSAAPVVRRAVELSAHCYEVSSAVDAHLVRLTRGSDDDLAEVSVWALGERWQERGEEGTAAATILDVVEDVARTHSDALVREAAVAALGAIGARRSVPVIISAASDKATVRRRAVIALAPFDGPDVDAALAAAREDRDWQVRQAAEDLSDADADADENSSDDEPTT